MIIYRFSWLDKKYIKTTKNPINKKDSKCFQCAVTAALNCEEIKKDLQIIAKFKAFINKYNWDWINYLSQKDDCEK